MAEKVAQLLEGVLVQEGLPVDSTRAASLPPPPLPPPEDAPHDDENVSGDIHPGTSEVDGPVVTVHVQAPAKPSGSTPAPSPYPGWKEVTNFFEHVRNSRNKVMFAAFYVRMMRRGLVGLFLFERLSAHAPWLA